MPFAWDPWALLGFISVVLVPTPALTLQICTGGTVQTGLNLNNHCTGASRRELRTHNGVRRYPSRGRYCTMNADNVAEGGGADGGLSTFYSREDLDKFCSPWGITLHYSNVLNIYRIEARRSNGEVAGYTSGFHAGDMLHLDTVQTQRKASAYAFGAPNAPPPGRELPWIAGSDSVFQLGAVLGCAAARYGWDRGAKRVELLAIKDLTLQQKKLVRYYRMAGFQQVREVGDDLNSLGDRLVWGGEGTLMRADIEQFLLRWTRTVKGGGSATKRKEEEESMEESMATQSEG